MAPKAVHETSIHGKLTGATMKNEMSSHTDIVTNARNDSERQANANGIIIPPYSRSRYAFRIQS